MCVAFFVNAQSLYYIHNGVHSDLLSMERLKKFVIYKDHIKLLASDDSEIASLEITDKMSFVIKDNDTEPSAIKDSRTARGDGYDIDFEAGCIHLYNISKGTKAFLYNLNGRLVSYGKPNQHIADFRYSARLLYSILRAEVAKV